MHDLPHPSRRSALLQLGTAALAAGASFGLHAAEPYPSRALRLVVPFPAAGSADILSRVLANAMAGPLGQGIVVDNRAGGGGALGMNLVAHAEPDGYTLGVTSLGPQILLPALGRKLPYNADKDFVHIGYMGGMPLAIVARKNLEANTLGEMVALAKKRPGKLSFGCSGIPGQLAIEQFKKAAGVDLLPILYKGDAPMATDLLGGQIDLAMLTVPATIPHVASKSFKILATTGPKRAEQIADVGTVAEQGYPGFEAELWYALTAPAGTPKAVVDKLSALLLKVVEEPEVMKQFNLQGLSKRPMDAPAVTRFIASERRKWTDTITTSGVKIEE